MEVKLHAYEGSENGESGQLLALATLDVVAETYSVYQWHILVYTHRVMQKDNHNLIVLMDLYFLSLSFSCQCMWENTILGHLVKCQIYPPPGPAVCSYKANAAVY